MPSTPDVVVRGGQGEVLILEMGCSFDGYVEQVFTNKLRKYQPLMACLDNLRCRCKLVPLIFDSLGHVHRLAVRGLQITAKQLARYCTVSAVVDSLAVWRRRCFLYP